MHARLDVASCHPITDKSTYLIHLMYVCKAFDNIPHHKLLTKLQKFDIPDGYHAGLGIAIAILPNIVSACVTIDNVASYILIVISSLLHLLSHKGLAILGSLLFAV